VGYGDQINMSFAIIEGPKYSYYYNFALLKEGACQGNSSVLQTTCTSTLYTGQGDFRDIQAEFIFEFYSDPFGKKPDYNGVIVGELIKRNGIYLKNNNQPYTPSDPCWRVSSGVPFTSSTYNASFCCTKFPKPIFNGNSIGSPCSNDTSKAWLDIVFVVDISNAMTQQELDEMSRQIVIHMEDFTFGQIGNHTIRTAIISYATDVTVFYQLTDSTTFEAFVGYMLSLSEEPNDDGGNVQGALQSAFNHLQTQKSPRKPLIVLIAAAYNSSGFQEADHTANEIRHAGIDIVVINFKTSDGVLSNALKNIASPGYYYVSDQETLYQNLQYALTQINCFCPPKSKQFRSFNTAWGNYTNYSDCLFGFNGYTAPTNAERACAPGVLVAVTSQKKLDFITDQIIPHEMKGQKKFTIGIHKSSKDNEWKWWNYNKTEYLLGNFPSISTSPEPSDNYGYMWNYQGFNWKLQTGNDIPLPYICQLRACDAKYSCNQAQT
jgi:hypothetical protein